MAEVFGAVTGGIALCGQLIKVCKWINASIKKVRRARQDIRELIDEAIIFAGIYQNFLRDCSGELKACRRTALSTLRLETWTRTVFAKLKDILRNIKALVPDQDHDYSLMDTVNAHRRWFFSSTFVKELRSSLSVARESMNVFGSLVCIKKLNLQLEILRKALANTVERQKIEQLYGMKLEKKIQEVEQEKENTGEVCRTQRKTANMARVKLMNFQDKSHDKEAFAELDHLYDFAESYKEFSKEVLPRSRSTLHSSDSSRSSRPISSANNSESTRSVTNNRRQNRARSRSPMIVPDAGSLRGHTTGGKMNVPDRSNMTRNIKSPEGVNPRPIQKAAPVQPVADDTVLETKFIGNHTLERYAHRVVFNGHPFSGKVGADIEAFFQALTRNADQLDSLQLALSQATTTSQDFKEIENWEIGIRLRSQSAHPIKHARKRSHISTAFYGVEGDYIWVNDFRLLPKDARVRDRNLAILKQNKQKLAILVEQLQCLVRTHGPGCTPEVVDWDMKLVIPRNDA